MCRSRRKAAGMLVAFQGFPTKSCALWRRERFPNWPYAPLSTIQIQQKSLANAGLFCASTKRNRTAFYLVVRWMSALHGAHPSGGCAVQRVSRPRFPLTITPHMPTEHLRVMPFGYLIARRLRLATVSAQLLVTLNLLFTISSAVFASRYLGTGASKMSTISTPGNS